MIIYTSSYLLIKLNLKNNILPVTAGFLLFPVIWEKAVNKRTLREIGFYKPEKPVCEVITGFLLLASIVIYILPEARTKGK